MSPIPQEIIRFLENQTCASICGVDENASPYCFSCFYAFHADNGLLYFKSSPSVHHSLILKQNPKVAGTILPDKLRTMQVQGLQFTGTLLPPEDPLAQAASKKYHLRFPFALVMGGDVWTIRFDTIKMTDSTKLPGRKTKWERSEMM
ncbi:MAG: pyridoxamine 5'-phosphate oxidase family protein [Niabella sp.]